MKIAIMTWFHYDRYGTVLQAAAMSRVLEQMGHEAYVIDYFPGDRCLVPCSDPGPMQMFSDMKRRNSDPEITTHISGAAFDRYREATLKLTKYCATLTDLESLNEEYDAFICGSDRIWLPMNFDPHYFLDFVKDPGCMVSYAPSILDPGEVDPHVMEQMRRLIGRFQYLSVREGNGRKYLSAAFSESAQELADPTLLLDPEDWVRLTNMLEETEDAQKAHQAENVQPPKNAAADTRQDQTSALDITAKTASRTGTVDKTAGVPQEKAIEGEAREPFGTGAAIPKEETVARNDNAASSGPSAERSSQTNAAGQTIETQEAREKLETASTEPRYLLTLIEGTGHSYYEASAKIADRLQLSMRIVPVHASDLDREGVIDGEIGPDRLIDLIRRADYICTDSYHVTLLALSFHKEFCSFNSYTDRKRAFLNQRVSHILEAVGLGQRLYATDSALQTFIEPIDYVPVDYKLDALRLKSRQFLEETLGSIEAYISSRKPVNEHVLEGYSLCNGCGACQTRCGEGAIQVHMDSDGFLRAHVDEEKCVHCGHCTDVCPFRNDVEGVRIAQGRLLSYRDADPKVLAVSSGGGLATRIARVLQKQGTNIAGCAMDENTHRAKHLLVASDEGTQALEPFSGSKYMQSEMSGLWRKLKNAQGPIAFFGTPCQVAAAKNVMKDRTDLLYIEIVCSGVPSYLLYEKYRRSFRGRHRMNAEHFELTVRYKQVPKAQGYIRVTDGNSERIIPQKKDAFSRVMRSGELLCDTCYDCRWRDISCADLRIGDYRVSPGRDDERSDESSVIALTDTGEEILRELMTAGYWEGLKKRDIVRYVSLERTTNPPKPVFYDEMLEKFKDDKVSLNRIINEYVKDYEKRKRWLRF